MQLRFSSLVYGRPPRGQDRQRQQGRKLARCQPMTVSGLTMTRTSVHLDKASRSVVQIHRSRGSNAEDGQESEDGFDHELTIAKQRNVVPS
jgi:hypothetical protein